MSGFANFAELTALVVDYAHRPELLERCQNIFVPFANLRLGRDLRSMDNEAVASLDGSILGDPMALPDDFGSIRSLWFDGQNGPHRLRSRDEVAITRTPKNGNIPRFYMIRDNAITTRPFSQGLYTLSYHTVPVLDATNDTNDVLTNYPYLYLYAALLELQVFVQDSEQRQGAVDTYNSEVKLVNRQVSRARADSPAGVGD